MFQKVLTDPHLIRFDQHNDRGAAILKKSFFFAADSGSLPFVINNASHQHSSHLHLGDSAEMRGPDQGVFPAVFRENRYLLQGNRAYRVEYAGDKKVFTFGAGVHIAVAVVMIHTKAKDQTISALIAGCQLLAVQQRRAKGLTKKWDRLESRKAPQALDNAGAVRGFRSSRPGVV